MDVVLAITISHFHNFFGSVYFSKTISHSSETEVSHLSNIFAVNNLLLMHPLQNLPMYSTWLKLEDEPSPRLAWEIVDHYFSHYHDDLMHEYVWYMLTHALTSEAAELEAHDVDGLLFFYEYTKIFSRAMFYIYELRQIKKSKPAEQPIATKKRKTKSRKK